MEAKKEHICVHANLQMFCYKCMFYTFQLVRKKCNFFLNKDLQMVIFQVFKIMFSKRTVFDISVEKDVYTAPTGEEIIMTNIKLINNVWPADSEDKIRIFFYGSSTVSRGLKLYTELSTSVPDNYPREASLFKWSLTYITPKEHAIMKINTEDDDIYVRTKNPPKIMSGFVLGEQLFKILRLKYKNLESRIFSLDCNDPDYDVNDFTTSCSPYTAFSPVSPIPNEPSFFYYVKF
jgi:hypothetical protein